MIMPISNDILSHFIVETLRLSGALAMNADEMVADIGLSSARWQVVGAIHQAPIPQPVAHLARDMRLSRQGVQRIVNELHEDGFIAFQPNPYHARAHLVVLTDRGTRAFETALRRQELWVKSFEDAPTDASLTDAIRTMIAIREHIERTHSAGKHSALERGLADGTERHD